MSTHANPTYEPTLRTDQPSTRPAADTDTDSWVSLCQRQFDATRTERIHNLVDSENRAMPKMQ